MGLTPPKLPLEGALMISSLKFWFFNPDPNEDHYPEFEPSLKKTNCKSEKSFEQCLIKLLLIRALYCLAKFLYFVLFSCKSEGCDKFQNKALQVDTLIIVTRRK